MKPHHVNRDAEPQRQTPRKARQEGGAVQGIPCRPFKGRLHAAPPRRLLVAPVPGGEVGPLRFGRLGAEDGLRVREGDGLREAHSGKDRLGAVDRFELGPHGRLWSGGRSWRSRGGRGEDRGGLLGRLRLSQISVKGDADEAIEGDADPFAVVAGEQIEGRRKSDIEGHDSGMVSGWPQTGPVIVL